MAVRIADTLGTMGEGGYALVKAQDVRLNNNKTAEEAITEALSVAKGRATGYVFDTVEALDTWLAVAENKAKLVLGDNLYIRATNVPDYWWDTTTQTKQPLETQKADLTEYAKKTYVDGKIPDLTGYATTEYVNNNTHTHTNKDTLDNLSSSGNTLLFKGNPIEGGSGGGTGASYAIIPSYSETEEVVGRWKNGKPIYRKVKVTSAPQVTSSGTAVNIRVAMFPSEIDNIIAIDGMLGGVSLNYYASVNYRTWIYQDGTDIVFTSTNSDWNSFPLILIVEYTKTTDAENSFSPNMLTTSALQTQALSSDVTDVMNILKGVTE